MQADLTVSVHPILGSVLVVDVEGTFWCIDGQHVIVCADAIPLGVLV